METTLICLFASASAANVYACGRDRQGLRRASKVLLMPLLLGVYVSCCRSFSPLVAAALCFGWLGDIFMIFKHRDAWMAAGMGSFGVGHLFYLAAIYGRMPAAPPLWAGIALPVIFAAAAVGFFLYLKKHIPDKLRLPSLCYCLLLCAVAASAGLALASGAPRGAPLFAGGLFFLLSDSVLAVESFVTGDAPRLDFAVMSTYIAAQALLTAAFCA